jgi:peptidoglycan/LPS O-acetylase OafA/YrhL
MRNQSAETRVTQLDGLRGVAALVVVACHVVSTLPGTGGVFSDRSVGLNAAEAGAVFSPLHLLWNGTPAVHVFFVLSGYVLVLPFTRPGAVRNRAQYYARRFFRLYLPARASLAVAVALITIIPRSASPLQSSWADMYVTHPARARSSRTPCSC